MMSKKTVYAKEKQEALIQQAKDIIMTRYANNPDVLAIYFSGSGFKRQLGIYDKTVHSELGERNGSDFDVMLVIQDRFDVAPILPEEAQRQYGVRYIGGKIGVSLYRVVDENGDDIFIGERHPIELLIFTKEYFEGRHTGKYPWMSDGESKGSQEGIDFEVWKESDDVKEIRQKYPAKI